jgi:protein disulfide-isomerase
MKLSKLFSVSFVLTSALLPVAASAAANWLTDLPKAQAQAKAENKTVLIDFTGSDWCGWCIRLKREVLSRPEFNAYAEKNLVLVEVDFPKRKAQEPALKKVNEALAAKYHVQGFPTLVALDAQGKELGRLGYDPGGPKPFLAQLARLTGQGESEIGPVAAMKKAEATLKGVAAKREAAMPAEEAPLYNGAPTAPPPRYTELVLKGISGPKNRRLAMINNQTLSAGDAAPVKVGEKRVRVRCVEVREKSVLVAVEGETSQREIKLREGL